MRLDQLNIVGMIAKHAVLTAMYAARVVNVCAQVVKVYRTYHTRH